MEHDLETRSTHILKQKEPDVSGTPHRTSPHLNDQVLHLQHTIGNHATGRLLQTKLEVSNPGDAYEQEADRVSQQVMNMPGADAAPAVQRQMLPEEDKEKTPVQMKSLAENITPLVQRQMIPDEEEREGKPIQRLATPEEEKDKTPVQMKPLTGSVVQRDKTDEEDTHTTAQTKSMLQPAGAGSPVQADPNIEQQLTQTSGKGSALPDHIRGFMEPRFGADFSGVRVHTGSDSVHLNRALSAQAFTVGQDIYYGAGKSPSDLELTAHELTHVVQQTGGICRKVPVDEPDDTQNVDAGRIMRTVTEQKHQATVQRQPENEDNESDRPQYPPDWQHGAPTKPVAPDPHVAPDPNQQPEPPNQGPYRTTELRRRLIEALGIGLGLVVFVAIVACFATGACEAATILAVAGAGAFLVVKGILKSMGVGVSGSAATAATDQGSSLEDDSSYT